MELISIIKSNELSFRYEAFVLPFKKPSGTSRGVLTEKYGWLIYAETSECVGLGECSIIPGLSPDFTTIEAYEEHLTSFCSDPIHFIETNSLESLPSLLFGIESALRDWINGGNRVYFENFNFSSRTSIPINGLIWMGSKEDMLEQVEAKLAQGFSCIKMKVGAINFEQELEIIKHIRQKYTAEEIVIRVDANGAFGTDALEKLAALNQLEVHSIEQPIKAGAWEMMTDLCLQTSLPIALDEELIGIYGTEKKIALLDIIKPQYIILKPSLHGGISGCQEWIRLAEERRIPWWMTSALESNVGLNVIAQFTAQYNPSIPQGLGTGGLYTKNFDSFWEIENGMLKTK